MTENSSFPDPSTTPLPSLAASLTEADAEVLNELRACHDSQYPMEWARPLDVGGSNGSDHSYRLSKMAKLGLVESRQRSAHMSRGSKIYRITETGRTALRAHLQEAS